MRIFLWGFSLTACIPKTEESLQSINCDPLLCWKIIEQYTEFQARCDVLLGVFQNGCLGGSQEPYVERAELLEEMKFYALFDFYPKSLEACVEELQRH